jgi:hypothetical protein
VGSLGQAPSDRPRALKKIQAHRCTFCVWQKLFDKLGWWNEIVEDLE